MEWVETTGKTIEEAKDLALDQLGVDELDADFEILEEPRTGLFKRVRGEARVRARVKPRQPRPKQERKGSRRSSGAARNAGGANGGGRARPAKDAGAAVTTPAGRRSRPAKPAEAMGDTDGVPSKDPTSRPGVDAHEGSVMEDRVSVERQAEIMEGFLVGLIGAIGADGEVQRQRVDEETIELDVVGDDLGLLIGPKGLTLQAVQDLARTVVQRREPGTHEGRVRIDISGYRQKRREALGRFVTTVAQEVARTGVAKALEPMNAADRKVAHDAVNDLDGVATTSEGQEPRRWVVISPEGG